MYGRAQSGTLALGSDSSWPHHVWLCLSFLIGEVGTLCVEMVNEITHDPTHSPPRASSLLPGTSCSLCLLCSCPTSTRLIPDHPVLHCSGPQPGPGTLEPVPHPPEPVPSLPPPPVLFLSNRHYIIYVCLLLVCLPHSILASGGQESTSVLSLDVSQIPRTLGTEQACLRFSRGGSVGITGSPGAWRSCNSPLSSRTIAGPGYCPAPANLQGWVVALPGVGCPLGVTPAGGVLWSESWTFLEEFCPSRPTLCPAPTAPTLYVSSGAQWDTAAGCSWSGVGAAGTGDLPRR